MTINNNVTFSIFHLPGISSTADTRSEIYNKNINRLIKSYSFLESDTVEIRNKEQLDDFLNKNKMFMVSRSMPFGAVGIFASNYIAWTKFLKSSFNYLLLLEDDAIINDNFEEFVEYAIKEIESGAGIVSLYSHEAYDNQYDRSNLDSKYFTPAYSNNSLAAYLISKDAIRKSMIDIKLSKGIKSPIDVFLLKDMKRIINVMMIKPEISEKPVDVLYLNSDGIPDNDSSTIQDTAWVDGLEPYYSGRHDL